jgi:hypothetical protein
MYLVAEDSTMSQESTVVSSLPDRPMSESAVKALDEANGVKRTISPTWQVRTERDGRYTEDLIIITDDHVRYLSRELDDGWVVKRDENYADDEEFEVVMDDVHDYACEYSEERMEKKARDIYGE